jgi:hypothetical protein
MKTTLLILVIIILLFGIGKLISYWQFKKQVAQLFANAQKTENKTYSTELLEGLPEPVQRYFQLVLQEDQPYIRFVRLKHSGLFKTKLENDFVTITGEQYFSTQKPQFIWKGTTALFTARDFFIGDQGGLIASILDIFPVVNAKGSHYDEGELQRWLAESVWFPTNFLPSEWVSWSAIDYNSAQLSFRYNKVAFHFAVTFNALGEIIQMETQRYMTVDKKEKWVCEMSNYQLRNNVKVPISAQVSWNLEAGNFCYAQFEVQQLEYDIPAKFD